MILETKESWFQLEKKKTESVKPTWRKMELKREINDFGQII